MFIKTRSNKTRAWRGKGYKYVGVGAGGEVHTDFGCLLDNEDLYSVISLEQQRSMLLKANEEYNADNYDPIYCYACGAECEDIYRTNNIAFTEGLDFCSKDCLCRYTEMSISNISEISEEEVEIPY